jgi:hypothetical protein
MDRSRGGNSGGPTRPPPGGPSRPPPGAPGRPQGGPGPGPGPGRAPGGGASGPGAGPGGSSGAAGQPPAAPERVVSRPPSTLTDMSAAAVQAALRAEGRVEKPLSDASLPGVAPAKASASPERNAVVQAVIDAQLARGGQEVRVQVAAAPVAAPDDEVSLFRVILLAVGLVLGALGAALPALALGWLVLALVVQTGTSEILERTGGLAPTTFGGGYWLSLGAIAGVLLWCAVRRLRQGPAPWRPLAVLVVALVVALWALVSIDACGLADVPDVMTTFTLLGADALVQYLLPVALLALLVQGVLYAWRVGRASVPVARRITAVAGCLGLAGLSAAAMIFLAGAGGPVDSLRAHAGDVRVADLGGVDAERKRYERVAATVDSTSVRLCR